MSEQARADRTERGRRQHNLTWLAVLSTGLAALVLFRASGWGEWSTAVALSALMVVYGLATRRNEYVSPDTKGDCIYYLGLLFTFASMVAALLEFTRQAGVGADDGVAETMSLVGNLGIALVTTIFGLGGRVLFSVFQASPGDVVAEATHGLAEAIDDMKRDVVGGAQSMEDIVGHLRTSARELQKTSDHIVGSADRAASTAKILGEFSAKVTETAGALAGGADDFGTSVAEMGDAASGFRELMNGAKQGIADLGGEAEALGGALERVHRNASALSDASEQARAGLSRAADEATAAMDGSVGQARALREEVARLREDVSDLGDLASDNAEAASTVLQATARRLGGSLDAFVGKAEELGTTMDQAGRSFSALAAAADDVESRMRAANSRKSAKKRGGSKGELQPSLALYNGALQERKRPVSATADWFRADGRLTHATVDWFRALFGTLARAGRWALAVGGRAFDLVRAHALKRRRSRGA